MGWFRRWQRDGTWQQILTAIQAQADGKGLITWEVSVDSTVAGAHQHAAGARSGGTGNAKNLADKAYSSRANRALLRHRGIGAVAPSPNGCDF